jgi:hypothetical protein
MLSYCLDNPLSFRLARTDKGELDLRRWGACLLFRAGVFAKTRSVVFEGGWFAEAFYETAGGAAV